MRTITSTMVYFSNKTVSVAICERDNLYFVSVSSKYKTKSDLNSHYSSDAYGIDKFDRVKNIYLNYIKQLLNSIVQE